MTDTANVWDGVNHDAVVVTIKYGGSSEPWAVFHGEVAAVRANMAEYFGIPKEQLAGRTAHELTMIAYRIAEGGGSVTSMLGGAVIDAQPNAAGVEYAVPQQPQEQPQAAVSQPAQSAPVQEAQAPAPAPQAAPQPPAQPAPALSVDEQTIARLNAAEQVSELTAIYFETVNTANWDPAGPVMAAYATKGNQLQAEQANTRA